MTSIKAVMSLALVLVASCILAANSAASANGIFMTTARLADASPTPPKISLKLIPCCTSFAIIPLNSAVEPGKDVPRRSAKALIFSNSGATLPVASIIDTLSPIAASSAWAYSLIGRANATAPPTATAVDVLRIF